MVHDWDRSQTRTSADSPPCSSCALASGQRAIRPVPYGRSCASSPYFARGLNNTVDQMPSMFPISDAQPTQASSSSGAVRTKPFSCADGDPALAVTTACSMDASHAVRALALRASARTSEALLDLGGEGDALSRWLSSDRQHHATMRWTAFMRAYSESDDREGRHLLLCLRAAPLAGVPSGLREPI